MATPAFYPLNHTLGLSSPVNTPDRAVRGSGLGQSRQGSWALKGHERDKSTGQVTGEAASPSLLGLTPSPWDASGQL